MKKTLAILLSLALMIALIPATASVAFADTGLAVELTNSNVIYNGQNQPPTIKSATYNGKAIMDLSTVTGISTEADAYVDAKTYEIELSYTPTVGEGESATPVTCKVSYTIKQININTDVNVYVTSGKEIVDTDFNDDGFKADSKSKINIKIGNNDVKEVNYLDIKYEKDSQTNSLIVTVSPKTVSTNVIGGIAPSFVIKKALSSTDCTVILDSRWSSTPTYDGKEYKPTIKVYKGDVEVPSTEYTVGYSNNINAGLGTVTVTGKGVNYTGSFSASPFTIQQKPIGSTDIKVSLSTAAANKYPTPTVTFNGVELKEGTESTGDYWLSNLGNGTVTVNGRGNFCSSRVENFTVVDSSKEISKAEYANTDAWSYYSGSAQMPSLNVYDGNNNKIDKSYYDVQVKRTTADKDGKYPTTMKDSGYYEVTVIGKYPYAGEYKIAGLYQIKAVPLDYTEIVLDSSTVLYDGVYVPKVKVKHYGGFYFSESDYTVTYKNLKSTYYKPTVVVKAVEGGNLTATTSTKKELTKEFSLASRNLYNCTVTFTDSRSSKNYDGNASFKPPVTVKDYSINKTLTENLDYKITYKDAAGKVVYALKDAGTYSVIVEGINAYTGTKTLTFTINGTDISGYTVTLKESSVNATGYAQTPVITSVKKGYYYSLTSNDYTVTYQDSTGKTVTSMSAPGTYRVVVKGKNGYSGSTYATFRIVGLPQTVTVTQDSYKVYATSESFKINAKASGDATGFTYTSSNPAVASVSSTGYVTMHKVGRAVITVTATGMKKYDPASTTVEVKVYPKKGYITKKPWTDGKKYQAKVRWTYQDGATSYQVKYSRDKNFGAGTYKIKTVKAHGKDYTTQSTTLKSLKSKSTYYIKVRAVYKDPVTGDTYYGAWSGWRSVKTK